MAQLFVLPKPLNINANLQLVPGARAYFYQTRTDTPQDTYQDADLTTPHANPVQADAAGVFPAIYLDDEAATTYRLTLRTSSDAFIYTVDPVNPFILTQALIAAKLNPITDAEIAAAVTPTNFHYSELDIRRYGGSPSSLDNTAAFNKAIAVANEAARCIVVVEAGNYAFTTTSPLTTMSGCLGIIGPSNGAAFLAFNHTNDCIVAKGSYKRFENIYAKNTNTTARASRKAVLRVQNCAYGNFSNVYVAGGADDQACFMLEQVYDGSADDGYMLAHLGCWYNTLLNVTAGYLTPGANVGYGILFHVAASARSVVNPTGQTAGTYTGSVSNNTIIDPNSESFVHDIFFDGFCNNNLVLGGQMLGGTNSLRLVDSTHNRFIGTALNQPATQPINESGSSARNYYDVFMQRPGVATPWSFGILSATSEVRHRGDGSVLPQGFFAPVIITDNDGTASQLGTFEVKKHKDYDKNGVVIKTDVEPTGTKALLKIERGTDARAPIQVDINGDNQFGITAGGRVVAARELQIPVIVTASLPAAGAGNNGLLLIEDGGAGNGNLVLYMGGQRFRIDGGAAF